MVAGDVAAWVTEQDNGDRLVRYGAICDATVSEAGRRIGLKSAHEVNPDLLSAFVVGGLLAHSLTMQGRLVLHASAVLVDGQAILIAGPSGVGKSTLAALACLDGALLISDDATRVDSDGGSGAACYNGATELRLREQAAEIAKRFPAEIVAMSVDGRFAVRPKHHPGRVPVAAVLIPDPQVGGELRVERLDDVAAAVQLLASPRLINWRTSEPIQRDFALTTALAGSFPVLRATIPWGPPFGVGLFDELLSLSEIEAVGISR